MFCKICGQPAENAFVGRLLKKHDVSYFRCRSCGFMQTEDPHWLPEAYTSAISDLDLGPINRAVTGARVVEGVILAGFDPNGRFIDWGGGYGVFTRRMRDIGYEFYWRDLYCQNLFAKGFEAKENETYELMTSFEVFEHLVNPMDEIAKMLEYTKNIFFTTMVPPPKISSQSDWWYFAPEQGQHVAFYSMESLEYIADHFQLHLCSDGIDHHLLSEKPVSQRLFGMAVRDRRAGEMLRRLRRGRLRKHSLLTDDVRHITGWNL